MALGLKLLWALDCLSWTSSLFKLVWTGFFRNWQPTASYLIQRSLLFGNFGKNFENQLSYLPALRSNNCSCCNSSVYISWSHDQPGDVTAQDISKIWQVSILLLRVRWGKGLSLLRGDGLWQDLMHRRRDCTLVVALECLQVYCWPIMFFYVN